MIFLLYQLEPPRAPPPTARPPIAPPHFSKSYLSNPSFPPRPGRRLQHRLFGAAARLHRDEPRPFSGANAPPIHQTALGSFFGGTFSPPAYLPARRALVWPITTSFLRRTLCFQPCVALSAYTHRRHILVRIDLRPVGADLQPAAFYSPPRSVSTALARSAAQEILPLPLSFAALLFNL